MSLPSLILQTEKIKLPVSGKTLSIRPFTVKEQKVMLIAFEQTKEMEKEKVESYLLEKFSNILQSCIVGDVCLDDFSLTDFLYVLIRIRSLSVGENQEMNYKCPCGTRVPFYMQLDKIECMNKQKTYEKTLNITKDVSITLDILSVKDLYDVKGKTEEETIINIVSKSIKKISDKDTVYLTKDVEPEEIQTFVENLPIKIVEEIEKFQSDMPYLIFKTEIDCPEDGKKILEVKNILDFFM